MCGDALSRLAESSILDRLPVAHSRLPRLGLNADTFARDAVRGLDLIGTGPRRVAFAPQPFAVTVVSQVPFTANASPAGISSSCDSPGSVRIRGPDIEAAGSDREVVGGRAYVAHTGLLRCS